MRHGLTRRRLQSDNARFAGTAGVSAANRSLGFLPAFRDTESGRCELARYVDGRPAPVHLLEGLPDEWAVSRDGDSRRITAVKASIVAGFVRDGAFFTREQVARMVRP